MVFSFLQTLGFKAVVMIDNIGATVLSLFCIPLLVFLFGPVPFVVGLGFAVFLWAAKLESRKIYNS
ncbi:hypothetical protein IBE62_09550, partial [Francisella philomiragia]|nr:hypothetical protein [Francisella philomiragia]